MFLMVCKIYSSCLSERLCLCQTLGKGVIIYCIYLYCPFCKQDDCGSKPLESILHIDLLMLAVCFSLRLSKLHSLGLSLSCHFFRVVYGSCFSGYFCVCCLNRERLLLSEWQVALRSL